MSQTLKLLRPLLTFCMAALILAGCSSSNSDSPLNPDSGEHPKNWVNVHGSEFRQDQEECMECHGAALRGGISDVSCFSASFEGISCHPAGPPGHPLPFTDPAVHGPPAKADLTVCQLCHADPAQSGAGSNPRFDVPIGDLSAGCETPGCHSPGYAHPDTWSSDEAQGIPSRHQTSGNLTAACGMCHDLGLAPCPACVGTICTGCHTAGSPITNLNCTSCHADPPDGQ